MAKRRQRKYSRSDFRPEGTWVLTPTLERHQLYRRPGPRDDYQVWHGPLLDVGGYWAPLDVVVSEYERREVEEDRTIEALRTGDPLATCRIGWHWSDIAWYTLANGGRRGELIVYWFGPEPFRCACRSLKCLGGDPIRCSVCGLEVDADNRRAPAAD